MRIIERAKAEDDRDTCAFVDDIVEVAELCIPHLRPRIIGSGDTISAGIGPHPHNAEIAISISQYCGFRIEDNKPAVEKVETNGTSYAIILLQ